jgi:hypothetical protein
MTWAVEDRVNRVHSDQMVLEMIRQGEAGPIELKLSGGQESKLRAKGLSD